MKKNDVPHRAGSIWRGKLPERDAADEGPPYQVIASDFLLNLVSLDPEAAKAMLPDGISCSEEPTGLVGFYRATNGAGITPYSACFIAVEVQGHDAPDNCSIFMKVAGWYSGRAGQLMHDLYDTHLVPGEVHQ